LLGKFVTVWQLEDLGVKILLLFRDFKGKVRSLNFIPEDFLSIFWEFKVN